MLPAGSGFGLAMLHAQRAFTVRRMVRQFEVYKKGRTRWEVRILESGCLEEQEFTNNQRSPGYTSLSNCGKKLALQYYADAVGKRLADGFVLAGRQLYGGGKPPKVAPKQKTRFVEAKRLRAALGAAKTWRALSTKVSVVGKKAPLPAKDLAQFSKEAGFELPALYIELMREIGPCEVGGLVVLTGPSKKRGSDIRKETKLARGMAEFVADDYGDAWNERLTSAVGFAHTYSGDMFAWMSGLFAKTGGKAGKEPPLVLVPRHGAPVLLVGGFADFMHRALFAGFSRLGGKPVARGQLHLR
jgi:hypothetical protein